jgi:hypothetical protein
MPDLYNSFPAHDINPEDGNCNDDPNGKPPAHYAAYYWKLKSVSEASSNAEVLKCKSVKFFQIKFQQNMWKDLWDNLIHFRLQYGSVWLKIVSHTEFKH